MRKQLMVTSDFEDELKWTGRYTPANIDQMLLYFHDLGVSRLDWIVSAKEAEVNINILPFNERENLITYLIRKAHALDIEVHAQYKIFETCQTSRCLPPAAPRPPGIPLLETRMGLAWDLDPFVAQNPRMRLRRIPGDWNPGGAIETVKLVHRDDAPIGIKPEELEIWAGERNGALKRIDRAFDVRETVEWRNSVYPRILFFGQKQCRVLILDKLALDEKLKYVVVKYKPEGRKADLRNTLMCFMEVYDANGALIPSSPACGRALHSDDGFGLLRKFPFNELAGYCKTPEGSAFLADAAAIAEACREFYTFECSNGHPEKDFARDGFAGIVRGKSEHLGGALNPVYPEVRRHWLETVAMLIDWGVDGINFRLQNHSCPSEEPEKYGFNEPSLEGCRNGIDRDLACRRNGAGLTEFFAAAAAMLRKKGLASTIHMNAFMFRDDQEKHRGPRGNLWPFNFHWEWEKWIGESADAVFLKGMQSMTDDNADLVIDRISRKAREHGRRVIYDLCSGGAFFGGHHSAIEYEIDRVLRHDGIDCCNIYETACFTRRNAAGEIEGNQALFEMFKDFGREKESAVGREDSRR